MKALAVGGNVDVSELRRQVLPIDVDGGGDPDLRALDRALAESDVVDGVEPAARAEYQQGHGERRSHGFCIRRRHRDELLVARQDRSCGGRERRGRDEALGGAIVARELDPEYAAGRKSETIAATRFDIAITLPERAARATFLLSADPT